MNPTLKLIQHNNMLDIFAGDGWENHTRFQLKNRTLSFVSGKTLTKEEFLQVKQEVKQNVFNSR